MKTVGHPSVGGPHYLHLRAHLLYRHLSLVHYTTTVSYRTMMCRFKFHQYLPHTLPPYHCCCMRAVLACISYHCCCMSVVLVCIPLTSSDS